jgi:hypothetical protein
MPQRWKRYLRENLVLWGFGRAQLYATLHLVGAMRDDTTSEAYARHVRDLYGEAERPRRDEAWECIRGAHKIVERHGGRVLLVVVPLALQTTGDGAMGDGPQREVMERCRAEGLECLDLLPLFSREGGWDLFSRPDFIHLSAQGHRVAGAAIADRILEMMPRLDSTQPRHAGS